ncbi:MAG: alpha/beta fold hydrolase [Planctomycetota bacterium]|nr:alpha/beta fold hydrolase [Planctomycetota bacterium]MDA1106244.1 alpha/beta fold hydrolase [Planctomycetota bacterium]
MPTTILLHGFLGAPEDFDEVVRAGRERGYQWTSTSAVVRAPALASLATGESVEREGIDALARGLLSWLESEGLVGATVVGYSLGARVALRALAQDTAASTPVTGTPPAMSRCILISGTGGLEDDNDRAARRALDDERARQIVEGGLGSFLDAWYRQPLFDSLRASAGFGAIQSRRAGESAQWCAKIVRACSPGRARADWDTIGLCAPRIRTIVGSMDRAYRAHADRMEELGVTPATVVPAVGHAVHLEAPAACAAAIERLASL